VSGLKIEEQATKKIIIQSIRNKLHTVLTGIISAQLGYSNAIRQRSRYD